MAKYEITKMLTLSTAHITKETDQKLEFEYDLILEADEKMNGIVVYRKEEYGWFIFISEELVFDEDGCKNFPEDLIACLKLAISLDCQWLCLDRDGEVIPDLKTFDW